MKNVRMEYRVLVPGVVGVDATEDKPAVVAVPERLVGGSAYIAANDHVEAEKKLRAHLKGKDVEITSFQDANCEVIG